MWVSTWFSWIDRRTFRINRLFVCFFLSILLYYHRRNCLDLRRILSKKSFRASNFDLTVFKAAWHHMISLTATDWCRKSANSLNVPLTPSWFKLPAAQAPWIQVSVREASFNKDQRTLVHQDGRGRRPQQIRRPLVFRWRTPRWPLSHRPHRISNTQRYIPGEGYLTKSQYPSVLYASKANVYTTLIF